MSIIKSIKQVLGLSGTASENHFWDGSVPNQLSLKRGTPDAPGAELIKALNGALSFPSQGQSLSQNGYVKLPGGLIVQWGVTSGAANPRLVTFPIPFPTALLGVVCSPSGNPNDTTLLSVSASFGTQTGMSVYPRFAAQSGGLVGPAGEQANWIALGY